jgi:hypothetical protein
VKVGFSQLVSLFLRSSSQLPKVYADAAGSLLREISFEMRLYRRKFHCIASVCVEGYIY